MFGGLFAKKKTSAGVLPVDAALRAIVQEFPLHPSA